MLSHIELSNSLFAELAGWEAMKQARNLVAAGRVLTSTYEPPLLRGTVQEGSTSYRSGLIIKGSSDAENLCTCRDSRLRGIICAHSVAVGLHLLGGGEASRAGSSKSETSAAPVKSPPAQKTNRKALRRVQPGEAGEPLEIYLILPPNFADAVARGKVMLYLEGKWQKGRVPLSALPLTVGFELSQQDAALLDKIEALNEGDTPAMLMLSTRQIADLLEVMMAHPCVTLGKADEVEVLPEPLRLPISATLESSGEILLRLAQGPPSGFAGSSVPKIKAFIPGTRTWAFLEHSLRPVGLPIGMEALLSGPVRIARTHVPQFLNCDWAALLAGCDVRANFVLEDFTLEPAKPDFRLHLAGGLAMLQGKLECFYSGKPVGSGGNDTAWLPDPDCPRRYRTRNFQAEQNAVARLLRSGFTGPDQKGLYHLNGQNLVLNFFAREFPRVEREWKVTLEERLERSTRQNLERIEPRFEITSSGEQWFDMNVAYATRTGERLSPVDIQRLLLSNQSHTRLNNGRFALLDTGAVEELQEVLLDCAPEQHAGSYRVANTQAGFLDASLRRQGTWQVQAPAAWRERAAVQRGEVASACPFLGTLDSVLRSYQKEGVAWLGFLRANGFGGILADEMGLGKTLQVLAHQAALQSESTAPSLVVCPTSLVFNWVAEAAKFTPALRVLAIEGPRRRELLDQIPSHDLVVTSYALLRRDSDSYRGLEFDTVILDEAQHIKNRQTQNAQAVKSVRCRHCLVLTGTPLENSVLDLWSIFDFLMPGYLGAAQDFRERYEIPIVREKSVEAQARLGRRLRPFIRRRLKRDVASELPERIEQVSYCELSEEQGALYQQVLDATRREVLNAVNANGIAKSRMLVLTALLRLRQICCDPRLLKLPSPAEREQDGSALPPASPTPVLPSGKVEMFNELLEEVLDGDHRVLVFSQFTSMLKLLGEELASRDVRFSYLDGSTTNRAEVVREFQGTPSIPVFLISLKAGGLGLNLTAADTVIHFDPWWNPAVEAQATDRAHRIGQERVVTSYKLITRGTVEEKILSLQSRKRALFQGMLGDEEHFTEALTWEDVQELLAS